MVSVGQSSVTIASNALTSDGTVTYHARQTDAAGNISPCSSANASYVYDQTATAPSGVSLHDPATSPGNDATPQIAVSGVEAGASVELYSESTCGTSISSSAVVSVGQSSVTIASNALTSDGTVTYHARQTDAAGNISPCSSASASYVYDQTATAPSGVSLHDPATSPGNDATPQIAVSGVEAGASVELYSESTCSTSISSPAVVSPGQSSVTIASNALTSDGAVTYYARQTDPVGNISACSSLYASYSYYRSNPVITQVKVKGGSYSTGSALNILVKFSKDVDVNSSGGNPQIAMTIGKLKKYAVYQSGSGSSELTFTYTISAGDRDNDGFSLNSPLDINSGTIRSSAAQDAILIFASPGNMKRVFINFKENILISRNLHDSRPTFAFLRSGGSVVIWGLSGSANLTTLSSALSSGVAKIFSTDSAFAALKDNGSVLTWGKSSDGGDSSAVAGLTGGVVKVFATDSAFAALKNDGSVVIWGASDAGGSSSSAVTASLSSGVVKIFSTGTAFAALKGDGSVVTWGKSSDGGDSSVVAGLTGGVVKVFATDSAFAALKNDGSVVIWGASDAGGSSSSAVTTGLSSGVVKIFSTGTAFAALKGDGSVVTWGKSSDGGDASAVADHLSSGVAKIFSTNTAFAALKNDGSVVIWGASDAGGSSSSAVTTGLSSGVVKIFFTGTAFAALKGDGAVVTWGKVVMEETLAPLLLIFPVGWLRFSLQILPLRP